MKKSVKDGQSSILTKNIVVCGIALLCTFLWGSAFPSIKVGYRLFSIAGNDTASQMLFAGYRFTLAGILTLIIGWIGNRSFPIPKKQIRKNILVLGLLQTTFQYLFFYIGLSHTEGSKGSTITAANYFFAIVMAHFWFTKKRGYSGEDRMNLRKTLGCFLGLSGVVLVNFTANGFDGNFTLTGEGCMVACSLVAAVASVYVKTFAAEDNTFTITGWQFLFGGLVLTAIGFFLGGSVQGFTLKSSVLLFYMAIISSVAFSLWTLLLTYNPVGKVAIYGFTNPIFGVLLSGLILGENAFTLKNLIALLCVCAGILTVNLKAKAKNVEN